MTKVDSAQTLARLGFEVFPIKPGAKFPPLLKNWPERAVRDPLDAETMWDVFGPDANIGIHCKGLVVIDVDLKKQGDSTVRKLDLPDTLRTMTPSGGWHLFYKLPDGHPGVPNGVDVLGPGVDIRSTNGYVVAPGSVTAAGAYRFAEDRPVADAPDWLVQKLGELTKREHPVIVNIPDADESVVEIARDYLKSAPRSVKGAGGDQTTYQVACRLRDIGVSYAQACELMRSDAWDDGCGWRAGKLEGKPIASAYKYAQNEPGTAIATLADFAINPDAKPAAVPKPRERRVERLSQFAVGKATGRPYLIKGLLNRETYAELYAPSGAGKTFVALDLSYHIAAARPWRDMKVRGGPVLYLAFEGFVGLAERGKALCQHYGTADVPLYRVDATGMDLQAPKDRRELADIIAALPQTPVLVVVDTFARALQGRDENSAQDVSAFIDALSGLVGKGITVLLLHHTGKNKAAGARGSSALQAALDTELEIDEHVIYTRKQRDIEPHNPLAFELKPIAVGLDDDGDTVTSCVVVPRNFGEGLRRPPLLGNAQRVFEVLCAIRPTNDPVTVEELVEACSEFAPARRAWFYDVKNTLLRKRYIEYNEDTKMITRKVE